MIPREILPRYRGHSFNPRIMGLVGIFMLLHILGRVWTGVKAISPAMELLVVLMIAYEIRHTVLEKRAVRKRAVQVREKSDQILGQISKGQTLKKTAPKKESYEQDYERVVEWVAAVESWITDTNRMLIGFSQRAATTFLDDALARTDASIPVDHKARDCYITLSHRLSNLRSIMERPEVYF